MIGSFWMIGGYVAVVIGGIALGLFHAAVSHWVSRATRRSILKGALYLAGVSMPLIWAQNFAFPAHLKATIWAGGFTALFYHLVVKPLAGLESPTPTAFSPPYFRAGTEHLHGFVK